MSRKSQITKVPFHILFTQVLTAGSGNLALTPALLGTRLGVIGDGFEEYRLTALKYRLHPGGAAVKGGDCQVASFYPGIVDSTSSLTATAVSEVVYSTIMGARATTPSAWGVVPRAVLSGPFPWYKTIASTLDASEETQGYMLIAGNGSDSYQLEAAGVMEFKGSSATANTPMALVDIRRRQRERLLQVIAGQEPSSPVLSKNLPKQPGNSG
jgi:hypothetical protein